ncbi:MAG: DUF808 family protein, partial [Dokdonella sp.]
APWAVTPLMMAGGAFLCYEGVEKLTHRFVHGSKEGKRAQRLEAVADESVDMVAFEKDKIKGAIRTDFILSAEIIVITLGTVADKEFASQLAVLVSIAVIMTIGVYGLVAGIVKLDDLGLYLSRRRGSGVWQRSTRALGRGIVAGAPWLMKGLSVAGTAAMFLVGGGILSHSIGPLHHFITAIVPPGGLGTILAMAIDAIVGIVAGFIVLGVVLLIKRLRGSDGKPASGHA